MTKIRVSFKNWTRFLAKIGVAAILFGVGIPAMVHADTLNRSLRVGVSGADVSTLQAFLAKDPALYPQGLVTGYFGPLTKVAVSNFQARHNLSVDGIVGPNTLSVLNLQIAGNISGGIGTAVITNVGINASRDSAVVNWNTNKPAKGVVYYSTSPLTTYEHSDSLISVSGNTAFTDANLRTSQSVSIQGLQANTTYYYLVYATNQEGNVSVTWPSVFYTTN